MKQTKKKQTLYVCKSCGESFSRWAGRCPSCEEWNTLEETDSREVHVASNASNLPKLTALSELPQTSDQRISVGIPDLNLILGGGLVAGSFVLIGGEPGVGKSTLLLEIAKHFSGKMIYFSGEESPQQIQMRSKRLGVSNPKLFVSKESNLENILALLHREKPDLAVIDSIQTVQTVNEMPGGVSQLRECAFRLMELSKMTQIPILITGHITKEGSIAGPKILEHMVDTVLYFESDRTNHYRILRATKNRFGPVGEVAIFEMTGSGLSPVHRIEPASQVSGPGRVYSVMLEGTRAIGVEVQALVARTMGQTRRMADGLDTRRLILLCAVLEKFLKLRLSECDVFSNLAGGLTTAETGLDLAMAASIYSSYLNTPLGEKIAFIGEVGLSGEIRPVSGILPRIKELTNLGFQRIAIPRLNQREIPSEIPTLPLEHIGDLTRFEKG